MGGWVYTVNKIANRIHVDKGRIRKVLCVAIDVVVVIRRMCGMKLRIVKMTLTGAMEPGKVNMRAVQPDETDRNRCIHRKQPPHEFAQCDRHSSLCSMILATRRVAVTGI